MASPGSIVPFLEYWRQLREGTRDNIIGGIIGGLAVALIIGLVVAFRKALFSGIRRLIGGSSIPAASRHELTIKVDGPQPVQQASVPAHAPTLTATLRLPNIPRQPVVGFVARRDKEGRDLIELLKRDLLPENNLLIVLWGEGGIGKTTLAAEAARSLIKDYGQRILWTSAEKRADFTYSTFLDEIAVRLDRNDVLRLAIGPKANEVQMMLAEAPTFVVLDNFETMSSDEAKSCAEFLKNSATCTALITTRQKIAGAHNHWIDAMSRDEAKEFLSRLIDQSGNPSAFHNLDRARLMQTAALNPLVMEWIVAQIALAQRAEDVLDDVAQGKGDAAQRVFDRSFNLPQLGDDGRSVLLALSLFVPSASREALAAVAGFANNKNRLNEAIRRLAALRLVSTINKGERLLVQGLTRELAKARLEKY